MSTNKEVVSYAYGNYQQEEDPEGWCNVTLQEISRLEKEVLTPAEIAPVLGVDPQSIRSQAEADPKRLGFPFIKVGKRLLFPRRAFLQHMGYKEAEV